MIGLALPGHATVLLDDTWADGTRTDTSLPAESAWYAASASTLSVTSGSLTGMVASGTSSSWLTYFTTNASTPVQLAVGETLKVTLAFTLSGVAPQNASRSLRIGLYDFADGGIRASGDGSGVSGNGANVLGYMLNANFGSTFGVADALQIMRRTTLGDGNLMSSSGDYTSLSTGGGNLSGDAAFSNNVPYTLTFAVTRNAGSVEIATAFSGGSLNISNTVTDVSATNVFRFDTFSMRPSRGDQTATTFRFTEFKVEVLPAGPVAPSITTQPQNLTAVIGQNATFTVAADGTPSRSYQWYFNTNTPLANATNATLTLTNVQPADAGDYSVMVTNSSGSVTSNPAMLTVSAHPVGPAIAIQVSGLTATITFAGEANHSYEVQRSTNLTDWIVLMTTNAPADGLFEVVDDFADLGGPPPQAYYRLRVAGLVFIAPSITTQPANQTVTAGQIATFTVVAAGTAPLRYQWYFNTNTLLANATNSTLTLTNVQMTNAGSYTVVVTNNGGATSSTVATLTVLVPPAITTQPQSQTVVVSNNTTFMVVVTGTAPLSYQWYFNTNTSLLSATNSSLTITNAQTNNAGGYSVVVTNTVGAVTSVVATLTVSPPSTNSFNFDLVGFGQGATGGGLLPEIDPNYRKIFTPGDLRLALANNNTKVIEIMNDLDLGWNEIGATNQTGAFRPSASASLHPALIASGVTLIDIQNKNGITIFSANGATIRHAKFNVKRTHNVLIRNLKFDELWEWDESSKGDYDDKDWDFITIGDAGNCTNVWIDHCDFTKAYDGVLDIKGGSNNVTISWCRFFGDDGGPNSFVRQQINNLETNGVSHAMYDFLRTNGFSVEDIIAVTRSQKKGHLVGATDKDADNANLKLTLHHNYYHNMQDRMPRLRAGNAHAYNLYINSTEARAAKLLRNARVTAMNPTQAAKLSNGTYKFDVTSNAAISTEDGAVLVEKSHIIDVTSPIRNNQTNPSDPTYTGKISALDTIYTLDASTFRGCSEDPGSPLAPVPAPVIPFSWNGFTTLPYGYTMDEPTELSSVLTGAGAAGSGTVTWAKTNWLKTSY